MLRAAKLLPVGSHDSRAEGLDPIPRPGGCLGMSMSFEAAGRKIFARSNNDFSPSLGRIVSNLPLLMNFQSLDGAEREVQRESFS